jgi:hypothetical protein
MERIDVKIVTADAAGQRGDVALGDDVKWLNRERDLGRPELDREAQGAFKPGFLTLRA